ncbi:MAG: DUF1570 domain-containing protein [Planctomycetia bacterium]|nr:DUF1570 domain-containing protein [Planctomycetia bacterium]
MNPISRLSSGMNFDLLRYFLPSISLSLFIILILFDYEKSQLLAKDIERDSQISAPISLGNLESLTSPPNYHAEDLLPSFIDELPYIVVLRNVVCQSNFTLSETDDLCQDIYQLQEDLVKYLAIPYSYEKIELCLFADSKTYIAFIKNHFAGAPLDRPALYIKDNGPGILMVKKDENMRLNIRHEMTHAFLNSALRNVPIWLDEGLAKYFEIPAGQRGFENPFLQKMKNSKINWAFFSTVPSLARLEKLNNVNQMQEREYRESWAWIHFLIHYSPQTQRLLVQYLQTLTVEKQKNISLKDAIKYQQRTPLTRILEKQIPDYKAKFIKHFEIWKINQKEYFENKREQKRFLNQ